MFLKEKSTNPKRIYLLEYKITPDHPDRKYKKNKRTDKAQPSIYFLNVKPSKIEPIIFMESELTDHSKIEHYFVQYKKSD